eukprot:GHVR01170895.1.p1 GENE.GHVR01170895.1~~GHVR01170895.1.p1  ORF type:complete len:160 (+),score=68.34 GHVR01170895.1:240-719(+)
MAILCMSKFVQSGGIEYATAVKSGLEYEDIGLECLRELYILKRVCVCVSHECSAYGCDGSVEGTLVTHTHTHNHVASSEMVNALNARVLSAVEALCAITPRLYEAMRRLGALTERWTEKLIKGNNDINMMCNNIIEIIDVFTIYIDDCVYIHTHTHTYE